MTVVSERIPDPTPLPRQRPDKARRSERSRRTAELFEAAARSRDEELSNELRDEVLMLNIGVARALARRFARRGIELQDLEQVACEALLKAVQRFDPSQDNDFLSFAVPTIRGELQRHFRDLGWMVRPTRRVQETQWRAARAEDELTARLGRRPNLQEVVAELDITPEEYAEAQSAHGCFLPASLDKPLTADGDGADLGASLQSDDRGLAECEARVVVLPAVRDLSERERRVLYLRYFQDLTQVEIGNEIGVGQAQVSRILNQALEELRDALGDGEAPAERILKEVPTPRSRS